MECLFLYILEMGEMCNRGCGCVALILGAP